MIRKRKITSAAIQNLVNCNRSFFSFLAIVFISFFSLGTVHIPSEAEEKRAQDEPVLKTTSSVPPFFLNDSISRLAYHNTTVKTTANHLQRKRIRLFIGIFTAAFGIDSKYGKRRTAIRDTWLPNVNALEDTVVQFVMGTTDVPAIQGKLQKEQEQFPGTFLNLDMEECYRCLPDKTVAFLLAVHAMYDADWVMKIDDDVYLAPTRLPPVMRQWERMGADYVGCMSHGDVHFDPDDKWYEPAGFFFGPRYSLHAYGSLYVVRGPVVRDVVARNAWALRKIANEDTTFGLWMLAFNVTFFEDMRLCAPQCRPAAVAFQDYRCQGLCSPVEDMYKCHRRGACTRPFENETSPMYLPPYPGHDAFDGMKVP